MRRRGGGGARIARGGAGAAVRRALPVGVAAGVLGAEVEPDGDAGAAARRVPPGEGVGGGVRGGGAGGGAGGNGGVRRVRGDARAHILLLRAREAHVGDHVVLPPARRVPGGGDRSEEGGRREVAAAEGGGDGPDVGIRADDVVLAVLPAAAEV